MSEKAKETVPWSHSPHCSRHPNEILPELLIWHLITFYWLWAGQELWSVSGWHNNFLNPCNNLMRQILLVSHFTDKAPKAQIEQNILNITEQVNRRAMIWNQISLSILPPSLSRGRGLDTIKITEKEDIVPVLKHSE